MLSHDSICGIGSEQPYVEVGGVTQQNSIARRGREGKTERLNYIVVTFPFINIRSKCSGKWSFQDNSMSLHDNDMIPRYASNSQD